MLANSPFHVHALTTKKHDSITLTVKGPDGCARPLLAALNSLSDLAGTIQRQVDAEARQQRTAARIEEWESRCAKVRVLYRTLRASGLKHLAAVRAVSEHPDCDYFRSVASWTFTDFHRCIGPASSYKPSLSSPSPSPKRRSRSVAGAVNLSGKPS
jgi:hypothetical protein